MEDCIMTYTALLRYELGNLEKIEGKYAELGLPAEHKLKFLELMVFSIHNIFELKIEPWGSDNYDVWNKILEVYKGCKNFEETKKGVEQIIGGIRKDDEIAKRMEEEERRHYEND